MPTAQPIIRPMLVPGLPEDDELVPAASAVAVAVGVMTLVM